MGREGGERIDGDQGGGGSLSFPISGFVFASVKFVSFLFFFSRPALRGSARERSFSAASEAACAVFCAFFARKRESGCSVCVRAPGPAI